MPTQIEIVGRVSNVDGTPFFQDGAYLVVVERFIDGHENRVESIEPLQVDVAAQADYTFAPFDLSDAEDFVGVEVRVCLDPDTPADCLGRSPLIVNASGQEPVDFVVDTEQNDRYPELRGPSEFEKVRNAFAQVNLNSPMAITELSDEALPLVAVKSGIEPRSLMLLRRSADIANNLGLHAETFQPLIYGLARAKLPLHTLSLALSKEHEINEALNTAVAANALHPDWAGEKLADQLQSFKTALSDYVAAQGQSQLQPLFEIADVQTSKIAQAITLHQASASTEEFWDAVVDPGGGEPLLEAEEAASLRATLQLAALTLNHTPLVSSLKQSLGANDGIQLHAELDAAEWETLLEGEKPSLFAGSLAEYAIELERRFEETFPTAATLLRLPRVETAPEAKVELASFYRSNQDFDLMLNPVAEYSPAEGLSGDARELLGAVQRLYRVTPESSRHDCIGSLLGLGFLSAHSIAATTPEAFVQTMSGAIDLPEEEKVELCYYIHNSARTMVDVVGFLTLRHNEGYAGTRPAAVGGTETSSFSSILQFDNRGSCPHCRSVFGPAAYLSDLLAFLKTKKLSSGPHENLLEALSARRPDLVKIELGCDNTHVEVPTIDIINEVLEEIYAVETGIATPSSSRQTSGDTAARRAEPEHCTDAVYVHPSGHAKALNERTDHLDLPFDLRRASVRAYLDLQDLDSGELMDALTNDSASVLSTARELLGIVNAIDGSDIETAVPTNQAAVEQAWGNTSLADLSKPAKLLELTGFDYQELEEVLLAPLFSTPTSRSIQFDAPGDIATATITPALTVGDADLLRRLLKLQRRSLWTVREIERGINILGGGSLDSALISKLATIELLHRRYRLDRETLINFAAPTALLDDEAWGREVSYRRRMLPTLTLEDGLPAEDNRGAIAAVLGLHVDELPSFESSVTVAEVLPPLFRHANFARLLRVPLSTYIALRELLTSSPVVSPTEVVSPETLRDFLEALTTLKHGPFTVDEARYIAGLPSPITANEDASFDPNAISELTPVLKAIGTSDPDGVTLREAFLASWLADLTGLDADVVRTFAEHTPVTGTSTQLWPHLMSLATVPEAERVVVEEQCAADMHKLHRQAMVVDRCGFATDETLGIVLLAGFGEIGMQTSGSKELVVASTLAAAQKSLLDVDALLDLLPVVGDESNAAWSARLAERVEGDAEIINTMVAYFGRPITIEALAKLLSVTALLRDKNYMASAIFERSSGSRCWLFDDAIDTEQLQRTKDAARGGRALEQWQEQLASLSDELRREKRDALVTASLLEGIGASREDLYGKVLVDFDMEPAQDTSRIKAAIGSVQQFIQRVFLAQEYRGALGQEDALLWEWMRVYRVWEANRKVFIYPENWLKPEFRDDKTPFFKELESELAQGEISAERAERAVVSYLDKLHEVSNLEICAVHQGQSELHVLGRTRSEPRRYYYRSRVGCSWAPWEHLEIDIEDEHVLVYEHNRRLYLLWVSLGEESLEAEVGKDNNVTGQTGLWTLRLCYCERRHGKWQRPRMSAKVLSKSAADEAHYYTGLEFYKHESQSERAEFRVYAFSDGNEDLIVQPYRFYLPRDDNKQAGTPHPVAVMGLRFRIDAATDEVSLEPPETAEVVLPLLKTSKQRGQLLEGRTDILWTPATDSTSKAHRLDWLMKNAGKGHTLLAPADALYPTTAQLPLVAGVSGNSFLVEREFLSFRPLPSSNALDIDHAIVEHWENVDPGLLQRPNTDLFDPWAFDPSESLLPPTSGGSLYAHQDLIAPPVGDGLMTTAFARNDYDWMTNLAVAGGQTSAPWTAKYAAVGQLDIDFAGNPLVVRTGGAPPVGGRSFNESGLPAPMNTQLSKTFFSAPAPVTFNEFGWAIGGKETTLGMSFYRFTALSFAQTYDLLRIVNVGGIWALYHPTSERFAHYRQGLSDGLDFAAFEPRQDALAPHIGHSLDDLNDGGMDFRAGSPTAVYNWELFFHIPLYIADRLRVRGEYAEARKWLHAIFDPTIGGRETAPARYWRVKPLYEAAAGGPSASLDELMAFMDASTANTPKSKDLRQRFVDQVETWQKDPFSPHAIARLRVQAYQTAVVMAYLDVLIEWADSLFRRDSMESINEATQLYMLAAEMLGQRPVTVPGQTRPRLSFEDLPAFDGGFNNASVMNENYLNVPDARASVRRDAAPPVNGNNAIVDENRRYLYFGIPENDRLLDLYWDRVADRLFKIHHSQNIEGVERKLRLFEPPIDPELLIRAKAMGLKLGDVLKNLNRSMGPYRFERLLGTARSFCQELQGLEGMLLASLEKRDAEEMSRLRATQEIELNRAIETIRRQRVKEAKEQIAALRKSKEAIAARQAYYASRPYQNTEERAQLEDLDVAGDAHTVADVADVVAASLRCIPAPKTGLPGPGLSPSQNTFPSSAEIAANVSSAVATVARSFARGAERSAARAGIRAGQERRQDDWTFQASAAERELATLDKQLLAAEIRLAMARKELENHRTAAAHRKEAYRFLKQKFSRYELYDWMVGETCRLHQEAYDVALDLAEQAQHAYCFELGEPEPGIGKFVRPQPLTGLRARLMAGKELSNDLRRMEASYLKENTRLDEVTRHISLAEVSPEALLELRYTGTCDFKLQESFFDMDIPGHYLRRIKSVALSLPSVVGTYTPIHALLTLTRNEVRYDKDLTNGYPKEESDTRFVSSWKPSCSSISTSGALMDTGTFEANLSDPRYLPFEGAGVISSWDLKLPPASLASFDYTSISDVVLHLRYTAKMDHSLRSTVSQQALSNASGDSDGGFYEFVDLRATFPDEWQAFCDEGNQEFSFELKEEHLPFWARDANAQVVKVALTSKTLKTAGLTAVAPGAVAVDLTTTSDLANGWKLHTASASADVLGPWKITGFDPSDEMTTLFIKYTVTG